MSSTDNFLEKVVYRILEEFEFNYTMIEMKTKDDNYEKELIEYLEICIDNCEEFMTDFIEKGDTSSFDRFKELLRKEIEERSNR